MKNAVKEFVRSALALSTLVIAAVFGISRIMCGRHQAISLTFELIALSFAITALLRILDAIPFRHVALRVLAVYASVCATVLGTGLALKWFSAENWWMVFLYVGIVQAAGFFLDMISVKRDVDSINRMLENRRKEAAEQNDAALLP